MNKLTLVAATLAAACSAPEQPATEGQAANSVAAGAADPRDFVGKPFSELVAQRREYLVRKRVIDRAALSIYSEADGTELPGQIRVIGGREVLLFFTCRRDLCSSASNIILVDLENSGLEVANWTEEQLTPIVDGPPELARFLRENCEATTCGEESEAQKFARAPTSAGRQDPEGSSTPN